MSKSIINKIYLILDLLIIFLTSGVLKINNSFQVDVFLVGGGGGSDASCGLVL